jgi:hypothetical protein
MAACLKKNTVAEERPLGRVSKDGRMRPLLILSGHPSRRPLRGLLRVRKAENRIALL